MSPPETHSRLVKAVEDYLEQLWGLPLFEGAPRDQHKSLMVLTNYTSSQELFNHVPKQLVFCHMGSQLLQTLTSTLPFLQETAETHKDHAKPTGAHRLKPKSADDPAKWY